MTRMDLAEICWYANQIYELKIGETSEFPRNWWRSSQEDRDMVLDGVNFILDSKKVSPVGLHKHWMQQKLKKGYVYDTVRREGASRYLLPWEKLTKEQKAKDFMFLAIVRSMKGMVDD